MREKIDEITLLVLVRLADAGGGRRCRLSTLRYLPEAGAVTTNRRPTLLTETCEKIILNWSLKV